MEWISVKDRLPEEGKLVLTFMNGYEYKLNYVILLPEVLWATTLEREQNSITHWMPLPEPPKE